jgi:translation initiation factor 3 subunit L
VADLLGPSELPHLLYRELFYRHIYSRLSPSLDDRIESWNNYLELFSFLSQQQHKLRFPHVWLFDLVDEFVWQAQSFNHYRAKVKALSAADRQTLASEPELWSALTVIQTLQKIVDRVRRKKRRENGFVCLTLLFS